MKKIEKINLNDEQKQIENIYDIFNEDERFNSKATNIEFLTTIKFIEDYLKPNATILDLGAAYWSIQPLSVQQGL